MRNVDSLSLPVFSLLVQCHYYLFLYESQSSSSSATVGGKVRLLQTAAERSRFLLPTSLLIYWIVAPTFHSMLWSSRVLWRLANSIHKLCGVRMSIYPVSETLIRKQSLHDLRGMYVLQWNVLSGANFLQRESERGNSILPDIQRYVE